MGHPSALKPSFFPRGLSRRDACGGARRQDARRRHPPTTAPSTSWPRVQINQAENVGGRHLVGDGRVLAVFFSKRTAPFGRAALRAVADDPTRATRLGVDRPIPALIIKTIGATCCRWPRARRHPLPASCWWRPRAAVAVQPPLAGSPSRSLPVLILGGFTSGCRGSSSAGLQIVGRGRRNLGDLTGAPPRSAAPHRKPGSPLRRWGVRPPLRPPPFPCWFFPPPRKAFFGRKNHRARK